MRKTFLLTGLSVGATLITSVAQAQPSAAITPMAPLVIANPHYATLETEVIVDRPAAAVWNRIGKFCEIGNWVGRPCQLVGGTDRELGAVRLVNNRVIEVLVGKTPMSYTYVMPVRTGEPYNLAHGTVQAIAAGPKTTRVIYAQVYDNSMLADDAARAADLANRRSRLGVALQKMKEQTEAAIRP